MVLNVCICTSPGGFNTQHADSCPFFISSLSYTTCLKATAKKTFLISENFRNQHVFQSRFLNQEQPYVLEHCCFNAVTFNQNYHESKTHNFRIAKPIILNL